ncbi:MAG: DUF559 domain-containing protein [Herbiconiux sp.]|uniref:DUF559 domain-containing protein n=1 Tax=Herbiconiux sp. TaxID=1871186 RepID=UPI0012011810|nr:DUF559 domain-containing protein [Herbiconiux sp.]TAJ50147.1 MAG: DUF559 domain-containing protein [Herbiconiux sp.]
MRHADDPLLPEFSTPRSLAEVGLSEHRVAQLVRAGSIVRVRHGHYARRDARTDLVRAVRVGGLLTSYPALKQWGLWCPPDDDRLHVSVNAHARALRDPDTGRRLGSRSDVVIHWNSATSLVNAGIVAPARAIRDLPPDLDPAYAVAAIDSALRIAACTRDEMVSAFEVDRRLTRALRQADPRAESGTESVARIRLAAAGIHPEVQVPIGRYRVDFLVAKRVVVEVDGKEFHDTESTFERDRRRAAELTRRGFRVLHFSYSQVPYDWSACLAAIRAAVAL